MIESQPLQVQSTTSVSLSRIGLTKTQQGHVKSRHSLHCLKNIIHKSTSTSFVQQNKKQVKADNGRTQANLQLHFHQTRRCNSKKISLHRQISKSTKAYHHVINDTPINPCNICEMLNFQKNTQIIGQTFLDAFNSLPITHEEKKIEVNKLVCTQCFKF